MLLDTRSTRFFQFISRAFGKSPSKAWLVRFKRRWQLSSRLGRSQYPGLTSQAAEREGVKFLERMHAIDKQPGQFLFVDKITLNQPTRTVRQLAPKGRHVVADNFVTYTLRQRLRSAPLLPVWRVDPRVLCACR